MLSLPVGLLEKICGNRILFDAQKLELLLSDVTQLPSGKESPPVFLNDGGPSILVVADLRRSVLDFISSFGESKSSHDTLPSPFQLLNYPYSCL